MRVCLDSDIAMCVVFGLLLVVIFSLSVACCRFVVAGFWLSWYDCNSLRLFVFAGFSLLLLGFGCLGMIVSCFGRWVFAEFELMLGSCLVTSSALSW